MKTKYVIFSDGKSPHTLKWIKELTKYYDLYLVSMNGYSDEVLEYIDSNKIYVLNTSANEKGGNYKLILKYFSFQKVVKEIKPKFVNAHYLSSYGLLAALIKRKNNFILIQSTWGTDILVTPKKNILFHYMSKYSLLKADIVTSDSYYMSDIINNIFKVSKILTFPFGLERALLNSSIVKNNLLIFSNRGLSEVYNINQIIIWFSQLTNKALQLVIANDGNKRKELITLSKELNVNDRVQFVGFLNAKEQATYYKDAKYYISIPSSDSTAVSLLEAMNNGCYPIVSNLPANREWIIDEFNGSFFHENMSLPKFEQNIIQVNQQIIHKKAIFATSIENYIRELGSL